MKALSVILFAHSRDSIGAVSCNIWLQLNLPLQHPWAQGHRAHHTHMHIHMPLGCDACWLQSDFTLWPGAVPCGVCWWYSVCVVMPVVTHQAVKGSAVCRLIVQQAHIPSVPLAHPNPGGRTQWLLHQCPLAATPEGDHIARSSGVKKWLMLQLNVLCQDFAFNSVPLQLLVLQCFEQVVSIFIYHSLFALAWRMFWGCDAIQTEIRLSCFCLACLLCFRVSCGLYDHHQISFSASGCS